MKIKPTPLLQTVSLFLSVSLFTEICFPTLALALTSGPASPDFSGFVPVSASEMVNTFTGDFN